MPKETGLFASSELLPRPPARFGGGTLSYPARWNGLVESAKSYVKAGEANLDGGERCRDTWERYAYLRWTNSPLAGRYESDLVDPGCTAACRGLSEIETTVLLAWQWDLYLENHAPGVEFPWQMPLGARRAALVEVLRDAVYIEAGNDGAKIEDRQSFDEDADDEAPDTEETEAGEIEDD